MKAILFAIVTTFAASASAADSIFVSTKLTRNGVVVDSFAGSTTDGHTQPHSNISLIKYRDSVTKGKTNMADLALGTKASITPHITSDGRISLRFNVDYVELEKMETVKVGNFTIDQPRTGGFKHAATDILASGEKREYKDLDNGAEYIYTVSATKQ